MKGLGLSFEEKFGLTATVIIICFLLFMFVGYVKNIVKLTQCDFEAPYKAEIIHAIGLIPVVGGFTGYINVGK